MKERTKASKIFFDLYWGDPGEPYRTEALDIEKLEHKAEALTDSSEQAAIVKAYSANRKTVEKLAADSWEKIDETIKPSGFKKLGRGGELTPEVVRAVRESYQNVASRPLQRVWDDSQERGSASLRAEVSRLGIDHDWFPHELQSAMWSNTRSVDWVENMTTTQSRSYTEALKLSGELTGRDRAFMLRESTGLTPRQVTSVFRARAGITEEDPSISRADLESALSRTASAHRNTRRKRLARLEIAEAFNRSAVAAGVDIDASGKLPGPVFKVWTTQPDERRCKICAPLAGLRVRVGSEMAGPTMDRALPHPPAHPGCRCVITLEYDSSIAVVDEEVEEDRENILPETRAPLNADEKGAYRLSIETTPQHLDERLDLESSRLVDIAAQAKIPVSDRASLGNLSRAQAFDLHRVALADLKKFTKGKGDGVFENMVKDDSISSAKEFDNLSRLVREVSTLVNPLMMKKGRTNRLELKRVNRKNVLGNYTQRFPHIGELSVGKGLSARDARRVVFHEVGHKIEHSSLGISTGSRALLRKHAIAGPEIRPLRTQGSRWRFLDDQPGIPSNLPDAYSSVAFEDGRVSAVQASAATEVLSTGLELIADPKRFADSLKTEAGRDHILFTLGALRGRY